MLDVLSWVSALLFVNNSEFNKFNLGLRLQVQKYFDFYSRITQISETWKHKNWVSIEFKDWFDLRLIRFKSFFWQSAYSSIKKGTIEATKTILKY